MRVGENSGVMDAERMVTEGKPTHCNSCTYHHTSFVRVEDGCVRTVGGTQPRVTPHQTRALASSPFPALHIRDLQLQFFFRCAHGRKKIIIGGCQGPSETYEHCLLFFLPFPPPVIPFVRLQKSQKYIFFLAKTAFSAGKKCKFYIPLSKSDKRGWFLQKKIGAEGLYCGNSLLARITGLHST